MNLNIFSDLRKPGLVPGESLSLSTKFDSVLEKNQTYKVIENLPKGKRESTSNRPTVLLPKLLKYTFDLKYQ